jgi:hypothetical protein
VGQLHRKESVLYYIITPLILILVYLLETDVKQCLILDFQKPTALSIYMNHYTHSTLSHLSNNLGMYLVSIFSISNLETDWKRLHRVSCVLFTALPFMLSVFMLWFMPGLPPLQGFSAISSGFVGYFVYAFYSYLRKEFVFIGADFLLMPSRSGKFFGNERPVDSVYSM